MQLETFTVRLQFGYKWTKFQPFKKPTLVDGVTSENFNNLLFAYDSAVWAAFL